MFANCNYSHIVSSINAVDSLRRFRNVFYQACLPYKDTLDFRGIDNEGTAWRDRIGQYVYTVHFSALDIFLRILQTQDNMMIT